MERRMKKSPAEKDVMQANNQERAAVRRRHLYGTTSAAGPDFGQRVIPGHANGSRECAPDDRLRVNPESRDSGFDASHRAGMTGE
jgi:hypothetical protein